jgi:hypothetical protein
MHVKNTDVPVIQTGYKWLNVVIDLISAAVFVS